MLLAISPLFSTRNSSTDDPFQRYGLMVIHRASDTPSHDRQQVYCVKAGHNLRQSLTGRCNIAAFRPGSTIWGSLSCAISKRNVPLHGYVVVSVASLNLISLLNYAQQPLLGERFGQSILCWRAAMQQQQP